MQLSRKERFMVLGEVITRQQTTTNCLCECDNNNDNTCAITTMSSLSSQAWFADDAQVPGSRQKHVPCDDAKLTSS